MRTNKFFMSLCLMAAAGMVGLSSCSQEDLLDNNGGTDITVTEGEGVYMGLTLKLPAANGGGRSQTVEPGQSTNGNEIGSTEENAVQSVLIVLAKASDNSFIVAGTVAQDKLTAIQADNSYKTIAKLQKTNIANYYNAAGFSAGVNVFVFCNPTTDLNTAIAGTALGDTNWLDLACSVVEGGTTTPENTGIWAANGFLMSNKSVSYRELPANIDDWNHYKTEATAFDLSGVNAAGQTSEVDNSATKGRGAVEVQRAVARFDFRDGSNGNNTYDVVKGKDDNGDAVTLVQVKLTRIALANMSNKFYYLPRVSTNGQNAGATICGAETRTNYVVGPYATAFAGDITTGFSTYFNYPFFNNDGGYSNNTWYADEISTVLEGTGDLYEGGTYKPGDYKVWRYVTENVIPGNTVNQQKGITTTVIFKGKMVATDDAINSTDAGVAEMAQKMNGNGLTGNPDNDPILYSFNNTLYFTWPNVQKAAIQASVEMTDKNVPATVEEEIDGVKVVRLKNVNRSNPLYVAVYGNGGMGTFTWGEEGTEYTDDKAADPDCANTAWITWNANKTGDNLAAMRAAVTGANFTIYQSSKDEVSGPGYYCYYYYYNRHNDNLQAGTMGAMEFGVVRNNVYKLAVTNISQLGHPRIPENDPDKPRPDEPDESDDIYLTVTCRVLPWVVRINDIEF